MYKFCFKITNGRHQMNALTSLLFHFPLSMTHSISGTSYQVRNTNNCYCSFSTTILSCLFICHVRTSTRWISFGYMWGKVYFQFWRQFTAPLKRRQLLLQTRHIKPEWKWNTSIHEILATCYDTAIRTYISNCVFGLIICQALIKTNKFWNDEKNMKTKLTSTRIFWVMIWNVSWLVYRFAISLWADVFLPLMIECSMYKVDVVVFQAFKP